MRNAIYCLHGFLGRPSDWNFLDSTPAVQIEKVDVFRTLSPTGSSMSDWAQALNENVARTSERRILLGYSMGGRLALHSLIRNPSLWDGAIIVSTNPGIPLEERASRISADEAWARRFETENWEELVPAWESLPVFGGKASPFNRAEAAFNRHDLAGALRWWSVGRQENLTPRLSSFSSPVLWITGQEDSRYRAVAQEIQARLLSSLEFVAIAGAAHRAPWEQPEAFLEHFSGFLRRVFC